ncbi:uncharacterized protein LOC110943633 [Helianthus annuus]|uniref:uncharacterized protein LOC110943633 n=1 Tax=Helianthus annuus TaxID=4232 RepID=UPI000B8F3944|nr:uncharacterized protein LOC110943633 [Helianthus annuus]
MFVLSSSVKDRNFLLVSGMLIGSQEKINITNVYVPKKTVDKLALRNKIREVMIGVEGMWVIAGDFNVVRFQEDRKNSCFKNSCARNFNDFIHNMDLLEYELKGRKYTCVRDNGRKLSKIDRFLLCSNFFNKSPDACLRGLSFSLFDHCPLVLTINHTNFGAKPFRVFNSWLGKRGYRETVESAVNSQEDVSGPTDIRLMRKFNAVRAALKNWRLECIKKEGEIALKAEEELEVLANLMEVRELNEVKEWEFVENKKVLLNFESQKCEDMKQKSRTKWALDGDENTKFFHAHVNLRRASNLIPGLKLNGNWVTKPNRIKSEVMKFFRDRFKEEHRVRPNLVCENIKRLNQKEKDSLITPFLLDRFRDPKQSS